MERTVAPPDQTQQIKRHQRRGLRRRIRRNTSLMTGAGLVLLLVLLTVIGPLILHQDPLRVDVADRLQAPSGTHWLGTDAYGRDVFARIMYGGRVSLTVGLLSAFFTTVFGMAIGLLAGYFRPLDHVLMRICDGLMAIPGVLLAIGLMSALSPSIQNVIIAVVIVSTPMMARVVRSRVLAVKQDAFVDAVKVQGASVFRILVRHIAPNCLTVVLVQASYVFADAIIVEATLSFLGVGVPPPAPSWGNILFEGKAVFYNAWWMTVFPGSALILSVVGLNFAGDGLRDLLDPRSSSRAGRRQKFGVLKSRRAAA